MSSVFFILYINRSKNVIEFVKKNLFYKSKNNNVTSELKKLSNFCRYQTINQKYFGEL